MDKDFEQTAKTRLKRIPKRGHFDRETVYKILDEGFICHIGFSVDGQTFVIPTAYGRHGDVLYLHGSSASRMMRELSKGIAVCVTVTLVDGLVLARSAFHHSMNYRSVVIFGTAELITDEQEKNDALFALSEHLIPQRWNEVREPSPLELKATAVLRLPIEEASAKIRTGFPVDDEADLDLDVWAGVIPLKLQAGEPVADELLKANTKLPDYARDYRR